MNQPKEEFKSALQRFGDGNLVENARNLLNTLGYRSERMLSLEPNTADGFVEHFDPHNTMNRERAQMSEWECIDFLFQLTDDEIIQSDQTTFHFEGSGVDQNRYESYLFFTLKLQNRDYTRTQLSEIIREINKLTPMPAMVVFQHGQTLTVAVIDRRLHKRDESKDVLEKVTLIKDINCANPHRAHIDILFDLSLGELHRHHRFTDFPGLHQAWKKTLDTEVLNKQFYKRLFNWFGWAVKESKFPVKEKRILKSEQHVIRLITRLLFVWFIKAKRLVADELFDETEVACILKDYNRNTGDSYYRAVLQNLFFATLNTEIEKREFSTEKNTTHRNFSRYRYKRQISNPDQLLELFAQTPFINGGLFDCLDSEEATDDGGYRIDCFSDKHYKRLSIPNRLFFDEDDGLFPLLKHYKFTVEENTPIEQEVALDPELLGKVFENLLAAYNPETGESARKQTGSYYTPRPIVDYMVEEALVATLAQQVNPSDGDAKFCEERLHYLLDYAKATDDANQWFDDVEADRIVRAISELKILDPAVGSGAFPMGVLHKLTLALRRLDPDNRRWEQLQRERAIQRAEVAFDTKDDRTRREELVEIDETFKRYRDSDFGRKLYLIQNSIFGVDIQSIACQIAKLRFFISLAIEQVPDKDAENFGIKPLPNLETRFVAANTLIGLKGLQLHMSEELTRDLERELHDNSERHFHAPTRTQKRACEKKDKALRVELAAVLRKIGIPANDVEKIARWNPYDQTSRADWFDPEWMFGIADGFDVVIGNPPYVRQEKIKELKPSLKDQYDCYTGAADLYVYFYERGFQLLRDNGMLTYISSNKYFRAAYGKKLRDFLARQSTVSQLIDFGDAPVFTSIAYPSIITARKAHAEGNHLRTLNWEPGTPIDEFGAVFRTRGFTMPQSSLTVDGWRLASSTVLNLLEKLRSAGKPLREYVQGQFYYGIKTGLNEAFVVDQATRNQLIAEHPSSAVVLKPFLRGRDVKRWQVNYQDLWLIFIRRGNDIDNYPAIKKHLSQYRKRLEPEPKDWPLNEPWSGRKAGAYKWYEIQDNIAYWQEFEQPQIVWGNLAQYPKFAFAEAGFYLSAPATMMVSDSKYLLGIMNSRITRYWVSQSAAERQGGFLEFKPMYISPIAIPDQPENEEISALVSQILTVKRDDPNADVSELENEIDRVVYSLYNLTPEEIEIVEEATK